MTFRSTDLSSLVGVEIHTDVATLLSGARADDINQILEQRGLGIFRKWLLDGPQQVALAGTLSK